MRSRIVCLGREQVPQVVGFSPFSFAWSDSPRHDPSGCSCCPPRTSAGREDPRNHPFGATVHMTSSIEATSSANKVTVDDLGSEEAFLAAIDETIKYFNDGDIVEGTVVKVDRDEVLLDIGYKTEGVIPSRELSIKHDVDPA